MGIMHDLSEIAPDKIEAYFESAQLEEQTPSEEFDEQDDNDIDAWAIRKMFLMDDVPLSLSVFLTACLAYANPNELHGEQLDNNGMIARAEFFLKRKTQLKFYTPATDHIE